MTTATARNGISLELEAQSGSSAPDAIASSCPAEAGGGLIAQRHASSGPTGPGGDGQRNGPRSTDDQGGDVTAAGVALTYERNRGGWYVGIGNPGRARRCDFCGVEYEARRSSSRFCSSRCRRLSWGRDRDEAERLT